MPCAGHALRIAAHQQQWRKLVRCCVLHQPLHRQLLHANHSRQDHVPNLRTCLMSAPLMARRPSGEVAHHSAERECGFVHCTQVQEAGPLDGGRDHARPCNSMHICWPKPLIGGCLPWPRSVMRQGSMN